MFIIRKNQTNNIVATASQNRTLNNPYYLFSFTHILSREQFSFIPQVILSNTRYDKFCFIESPNENLSAVPPLVTFPYLGQYYYTIYEQVSPTNLNPALAYNEVENGRAVCIIGNDQEQNCFYEQFLSDNETNENIIFISDKEQECLAISPSPTPSVTITPTQTSVTPTVTPTNTATPTVTPTNTLTPSPTVTQTVTPTTTTNQIFYYYDILLCSGGPGASNKIRSSVPIAIGSSVSLAANPTCYEVISLSDPSGVSVGNFNTYANCNYCLGITQTPTRTPTSTPTPTVTPTITPSQTPPLSFLVATGATKSDACNSYTGGGTLITVYAQDLGNCGGCIGAGLNCWACLSTSQLVYLDSGLTIPVPNGFYTNDMDTGAGVNYGTWNIIGGFPQGGGFSSGCP